MKKLTLIIGLFSLIFSVNAMAMGGGGSGGDGGGHGGGDVNMGTDHSNQSMEQSGMDMSHGSESMGGTFKHSAMAGDVHTEFQVMDLASMNTKDSEGNTHHVMVTFEKNGEKLGKVVGKMKLISPSGKEQMASLKDYGNGIYAANFNIDEPGKWGIINLFKADESQHTVKFWYPHMNME